MDRNKPTIPGQAAVGAWAPYVGDGDMDVNVGTDRTASVALSTGGGISPASPEDVAFKLTMAAETPADTEHEKDSLDAEIERLIGNVLEYMQTGETSVGMASIVRDLKTIDKDASQRDYDTSSPLLYYTDYYASNYLAGNPYLERVLAFFDGVRDKGYQISPSAEEASSETEQKEGTEEQTDEQKEHALRVAATARVKAALNSDDPFAVARLDPNDFKLVLDDEKDVKMLDYISGMKGQLNGAQVRAGAEYKERMDAKKNAVAPQQEAENL